MSVNIFGSSGAASSVAADVTKKYVDEKFKTLTTNLRTKVDKFGDTISGNLNILVEHDESKRTFGVPNISAGKTVILYLGDAKNMIYHKFDDPMKMTASHGFKFSTPVWRYMSLRWG